VLNLEIRKVVSVVETTHREMGAVVPASRGKVATALVMANPYAGCYVDDLSAHGKAAIAGAAGEIEHAAAVIHPKFGAPIRAALGKGPAIIPRRS
jgi:hypothetical protein